MEKEKKMKLLVLVVIAGFVCAVVFHSVNNFTGRGYPYNTFLFRPDDRFMDFFNPLRGSFDLDPYNPARINFIGGYLPFGYFVSFVFSLIQPWTIALSVFISIFIAYLIWYVHNMLYQHRWTTPLEWINVFALALLTYPVLFILDRANFDVVVFIFMSLFAYFYERKKTTFSILLLSFPIAMKGYPLVLLAIPLLDKRFRDIFLSIGLTIILEIVSLSIFQGGLIEEFNKMIVSFGTAYSIAFQGGGLIRFNSSLFTFLLFLNPSLIASPWFNRGYVLVVLFVFLTIMAIIYKNNYPFWRRLLIITVAMILFPQSSGDYRLILLYPPLMAFLEVSEPLTTDSAIATLLALILIPKAYYVFYEDVNIGIVLNPLLLIILLIIILIPISNPARLNLIKRMNKSFITEKTIK